MISYVIRDEDTIRILTNEDRYIVVVSINTDKKTAYISNADFTGKELISYDFVISVI